MNRIVWGSEMAINGLRVGQWVEFDYDDGNRWSGNITKIDVDNKNLVAHFSLDSIKCNGENWVSVLTKKSKRSGFRGDRVVWVHDIKGEDV